MTSSFSFKQVTLKDPIAYDYDTEEIMLKRMMIWDSDIHVKLKINDNGEMYYIGENIPAECEDPDNDSKVFSIYKLVDDKWRLCYSSEYRVFDLAASYIKEVRVIEVYDKVFPKVEMVIRLDDLKPLDPYPGPVYNICSKEWDGKPKPLDSYTLQEISFSNNSTYMSWGIEYYDAGKEVVGYYFDDLTDRKYFINEGMTNDEMVKYLNTEEYLTVESRTLLGNTPVIVTSTPGLGGCCNRSDIYSFYILKDRLWRECLAIYYISGWDMGPLLQVTNNEEKCIDFYDFNLTKRLKRVTVDELEDAYHRLYDK